MESICCCSPNFFGGVNTSCKSTKCPTTKGKLGVPEEEIACSNSLDCAMNKSKNEHNEVRKKDQHHEDRIEPVKYEAMEEKGPGTQVKYLLSSRLIFRFNY